MGHTLYGSLIKFAVSLLKNTTCILFIHSCLHWGLARRLLTDHQHGDPVHPPREGRVPGGVAAELAAGRGRRALCLVEGRRRRRCLLRHSCGLHGRNFQTTRFMVQFRPTLCFLLRVLRPEKRDEFCLV